MDRRHRLASLTRCARGGSASLPLSGAALKLEVLPGGSHVGLDSIGHLLIPGRGRAGGERLSREARARVDLAYRMFLEGYLPEDGLIVCSGYKSPADRSGAPWVGPDGTERFLGVPEADLMVAELRRRGVPSHRLRVERHSIDTVTNLVLVEAEGLFGDDRTVAILAQRAHLRRIMEVIAPRVMRRPFVGVVVPEAIEAGESRFAWLASRLVLARLPADPGRARAVALRRAAAIWSLARFVRGGRSYHCE